jgi:hypothetical protein
VFGFLPRPQLGELVSLIGDWYFASKAQFYLHECGQITLGDLDIDESAIENGHVIVVVNGRRVLPLADVPMPENVKNFKHIYIRFIKCNNYNFFLIYLLIFWQCSRFGVPPEKIF